MAKYIYGVNFLKNLKFYNKTKRVFIVLIILILLVLVWVFIDSWLQSRRAGQPSKVSAPTISTILPSTEIFTTDYFQFQTEKSWYFIESESVENKYVYRRIRNGLVEADMTIFINSGIRELAATRVLPVTISEGSYKLTASKVSEHCREVIPEASRVNAGDEALKFETVSFLCDVDGKVYSVVVGLSSSTNQMDLTRPDGTNAKYMIFFNDVRFSALPNEFVEIIDTFQIR